MSRSASTTLKKDRKSNSQTRLLPYTIYHHIRLSYDFGMGIMYMLIVVSMALKRAAAALLLLVAPRRQVQASAMDLRVISQMESTICLEVRVSSSNHHGGDQAEEWCGRPTHVDVMSKEKKNTRSCGALGRWNVGRSLSTQVSSLRSRSLPASQSKRERYSNSRLKQPAKTRLLFPQPFPALTTDPGGRPVLPLVFFFTFGLHKYVLG
ncbi:hypothetical protein BKA83DRAFT_1214467 [Pisolithus microcarpus]|nr:hypothetical protein BKA83DRAFT_1214467 [Pisolithus microcarpus]